MTKKKNFLKPVKKKILDHLDY